MVLHLGASVICSDLTFFCLLFPALYSIIIMYGSVPIRNMNANTNLRSSGTQNGAREITKDIDEQPEKLSDGEAVGKREMLPANKRRGQTEDVAGSPSPWASAKRCPHATAAGRRKTLPAHRRRGQHIRRSGGEAVRERTN